MNSDRNSIWQMRKMFRTLLRAKRKCSCFLKVWRKAAFFFFFDFSAEASSGILLHNKDLQMITTCKCHNCVHVLLLVNLTCCDSPSVKTGVAEGFMGTHDAQAVLLCFLLLPYTWNVLRLMSWPRLGGLTPSWAHQTPSSVVLKLPRLRLLLRQPSWDSLH